jgi:hypothetical protein
MSPTTSSRVTGGGVGGSTSSGGVVVGSGVEVEVGDDVGADTGGGSSALHAGAPATTVTSTTPATHRRLAMATRYVVKAARPR